MSTSHRVRDPREGSSLPPTVDAPLTDGAMREYWLGRAEQHTRDSYAGVPLSKMPEDLRTYEHLLFADAPSVVIEIGTQAGGGALWFRDRLETLARYGRLDRRPRVISVDIAQDRARELLPRADRRYEETITLLAADVRDPETAEQVGRLVPSGSRCLVVEDSAHEYDTTWAALEGFSRFVRPGGFFVVEDGCVDIDALRLTEGWPRGVLPALEDWLGTPAGRDFHVRRDLELYGLSCHPNGFLQRR